jgi:hypothetical protein
MAASQVENFFIKRKYVSLPYLITENTYLMPIIDVNHINEYIFFITCDGRFEVVTVGYLFAELRDQLIRQTISAKIPYWIPSPKGK